MDLNKILKTKYQFTDKAIKEIDQENKEKISQKLEELGIKEPTAGQVYQSLIYKVGEAEDELLDYIGHIDCGSREGMQNLLNEALRLFPPKVGFFLKEEAAQEMIIKTPPKKLIKILGYSDVDELLSKENLFEVYGSLRFVQSNEWMHKFLENYQKLTKDDFEKRTVKVKVLSPKRWHQAAEKFVKNKYHNLTHLKELGVLFALPREASHEVGVTLTSFSLMLHYFHEISMYSQAFTNLENGDKFGSRIIPILKGECIQDGWLIIPQYLEKKDNPPKKMYQPHINPEAIFWKKATQDLMKLARELNGSALSFWADLNWIGDYFPTLNSKKRFITFNFPDVSISYANQLPLSKRYLYHFHEALWNRIFEIEHNNDIEKYFYEQYQ